MYLYLGPGFDKMVEDHDTKPLGIQLFLICVFIAIQDVAIDGMVQDILNPEDYQAGALMQSLG